MEKKSATRPHSPKPHGVVINPLLVATIQRLPQKTTESTFPSPGTLDCHDPGHKSILEVSNFAQTPDGQRRTLTSNRYAIAKRSVFNSTS